ncbi:MAG: hypothetical protein ACOCXH_09145, partial [Cyclobacteriaceae bacterium]
MKTTRRRFLEKSAITIAGVMTSPLIKFTPEVSINTVTGTIEPEEMGSTLPHEHLLVDFIGADKVSPERYNRAEVIR